MNPGGLALMILGAWVIAQVTVGDALGRLGIIHDSNTPAPATPPAAPKPNPSPWLDGNNNPVTGGL